MYTKIIKLKVTVSLYWQKVTDEFSQRYAITLHPAGILLSHVHSSCASFLLSRGFLIMFLISAPTHRPLFCLLGTRLIIFVDRKQILSILLQSLHPLYYIYDPVLYFYSSLLLIHNLFHFHIPYVLQVF